MEKRIVQNLLYKDLSYQIHGAAIEVRKDFGPGHKEKLYQEAFARELERRKISFEKEKAIKIYSPKDGKYIGLYRPDFIIDEKIIIEIKAEKFVSQDEIKRIYDYLRNSKYELAYFINFASPRLYIKRIILTNDRKPFNNPPKDTNIKPKNTKLVSISSILVVISGLLLGLILALFGGLRAEAARLYFEPQELTIGTEGEFLVGINIDADKRVNAFSAAVSISGPLIPFDINEANSIINFWIEKPNWDKTTGLLTFSGITPGGFQGKNGRLLVIKFKAEREEGSAVLGFDKEKTKVYLHTRDGVEDSLELAELRLPIVKGKENIPVQISDNDPPEWFVPEISQDPTIFEGKYFLVFATQDKGSGIDHYEVCEGSKTKCVIAESPYLLQNQELNQKIFVKAIDKSGNERMAIVEPRYPLKWYEVWWIWIIIIFGIVIGYILWKKLPLKFY